MTTTLTLGLLAHELGRVSGADWILLFSGKAWANWKRRVIVENVVNFGLVLDLGPHQWWARLSPDDVGPVLKWLYLFSATITPVLPAL